MADSPKPGPGAPATRFQAPILNWFRSAFNLDNQTVATEVNNDPIDPVVDIVANRYWPELLHLSNIRSNWGWLVQPAGVGNTPQFTLFSPPTEPLAFVVLYASGTLLNAGAFKNGFWDAGVGQVHGAGSTFVNATADTFMGPFSNNTRLFTDPTGTAGFSNFFEDFLPSPTGNLVTVPVILQPGWGFSLNLTTALVAGDTAYARFQWLEVPLALI